MKNDGNVRLTRPNADGHCKLANGEEHIVDFEMIQYSL